MTRLLSWRCDGCGTTRATLPRTWLEIRGINEDAPPRHYCEACPAIDYEWRRALPSKEMR